MITKPTLILDEKKCLQNIEAMAEKASRNKVIFRPHFKTHQSIDIGNWFKKFGVDSITVSSFEMALYFSDDWNDITVAFPVNILEIKTINFLAEKINLNIVIESFETVEFLNKSLKYKVGFFIKLDVGYHRTGILPERFEHIDQIISESKKSNLLELKGFLTHAGQTYHARSKEEIVKIHHESIARLRPIRKKYERQYPGLIISVGDTPSCSAADDFSMFDEMRPGNFVFYDLSQVLIGACRIEHIAVALACPIVAKHYDRSELVIYGGGIHFSKERLEDEKFGTIFGKVVEPIRNGWGNLIPEMYVKNLSQEHGIVSVAEEVISNYKVGDYLLILPVHSCMTANLLDGYLTTDGKHISKFRY